MRYGGFFSYSFVFGSSKRHKRLSLFWDLLTISSSIYSPWIILGDFNRIANFDERLGSPVCLHEVQPIRDCMAWCNVYDLPFNGRFFTWNNKQSSDKRVMSKIDRVLGNALWEEAYPNSVVSFLPKGAFDHSPMLVSSSIHQRGKILFRFFNYWCSKKGLMLLKRHQKLLMLKKDLKRLFGRDQLHIDMLKAETHLLDVQEQLHSQPSNVILASQEQEASHHLKMLQFDFESSIRQKAKLNWVAFGDDNTKFFHQSIRHSNRINRISYLHVNGADISDPSMIHQEFYKFYSNLFCPEPAVRSSINFQILRSRPILFDDQRGLLDVCFSKEEIKVAM